MPTKTKHYICPKNGSIHGRVDPVKRRLLVEIKDDVTSSQVPLLRRGLKEILDEAPTDSWTALYLDLRSARMVDSMGVNWLFAESVRVKEFGRTMVIRISSPAINRVMQFAGLDKLVVLKFRRRKQTR
jgi:anti-anti-sigma factor